MNTIVMVVTYTANIAELIVQDASGNKSDHYSDTYSYLYHIPLLDDLIYLFKTYDIAHHR